MKTKNSLLLLKAITILNILQKKKRERDVDQIELKSHEAQRRSWRRGGGRGCGLKTLRAMKSSSTGENSLGENRIRRKPRDQMS